MLVTFIIKCRLIQLKICEDCYSQHVALFLSFTPFLPLPLLPSPSILLSPSPSLSPSLSHSFFLSVTFPSYSLSLHHILSSLSFFITHTHALTRTHTHALSPFHTHTHTHTHTHIHSLSLSLSFSFFLFLSLLHSLFLPL